MDIAQLEKRFGEIYGRPPQGAVRAPGRVNLIGEHTDYNDGFVLPIAIERQTVALWAPRDDLVVNFRSLQQEQPASVDLAAGRTIQPGQPAWANYCKGVTAGIFALYPNLPGVDVLLDSDVPVGGGLSSSASLEVATAMALLAAMDRVGEMPADKLALLCQKAEHQFAGAPCGIMDQTIAIMGQAGHALLLDCRYLKVRQIPFSDSGAVVLVADTQVKHAISDGGYAARRTMCFAAADELHVKALRDADYDMVASAHNDGRIGAPEYRRARHVIGEIRRTLHAAEALSAGDYKRFGRLMYESHASLRDDYEVSCDELDAIVDLARACQGVYGARMTGGGFGGCAIILAQTDQAEAITQAVREGFARRFGRQCPIFATRAAAGASVIELV